MIELTHSFTLKVPAQIALPALVLTAAVLLGVGLSFCGGGQVTGGPYRVP